MSVTASIRDIKELNPYVRAKVVEWINRCNASGLDVKISETYRTPERQEYLYLQNLTTIKTLGAHYFRVAIDFYFVENGATAYPAVKMKAAAEIAKSMGFKWGGDWITIKDTPHLEFLGNLTLAQYRQGLRPPWYNWQPELEEEDMKRYNTLEEIRAGLGDWAFETINKLVKKGTLKGDKLGNLNLTEDAIRIYVVHDREGLYGP